MTSTASISACQSGRVLEGKLDGKVSLWELDRENVRGLKHVIDIAGTRPISNVRISIGGNYGIIGDSSGLIRLSQLQSPLKTTVAPAFDEPGNVIGVDFADHSNFLLYSTTNATLLWDFRIKTAQKVHQYGVISKCKIDKAGVSIALNTEEGFLSLWDLRTMKPTVFLQADLLSTMTSMSFSSNGSLLACGYRNGNVVIRENKQNWSVVKEFVPLPQPVSSLLFSHCDNVLYVGSHSSITKAHPQVSQDSEINYKTYILDQWSDSFVTEMAILCGENEMAVFSHNPKLQNSIINLKNEEIWNQTNVEGILGYVKSPSEPNYDENIVGEPQSPEPVFKKPLPVDDGTTQANIYFFN